MNAFDFFSLFQNVLYECNTSEQPSYDWNSETCLWKNWNWVKTIEWKHQNGCMYFEKENNAVGDEMTGSNKLDCRTLQNQPFEWSIFILFRSSQCNLQKRNWQATSFSACKILLKTCFRIPVRHEKFKFLFLSESFLHELTACRQITSRTDYIT